MLSKVRVFIIVCLLLIQSTGLSQGGQSSKIYTVGIPGSDAQFIAVDGSAQTAINEALKAAYDAGGGTVYLLKGTYNINDQIKIGSNTKWTGDSDAIIRVSSSTTQFFVDGVGVVGQLDKGHVKNIEICGFQIDGNCDELPKSFANSGPGDHNAERLIELRGYTTDFGNGIAIHNMRMYDAFSDAIHIYYSNNVYCFNNFISNCQHSSIFYVCVIGGTINNNKIAGITSDCARLDNCQNIKVYKNIFYSYTGDNSNGAFQKGQNGLQVGDQGFSHGGGSDKDIHTTNIEVYDNTFADCGRTSIWLDAAGKTPGTNVYVHGNKYVDVPVVETSGTPVSGVYAPSSDDVSYDSLPTEEMSEKVFTSISSIFDVMYLNFASKAGINDTVVLPEGLNSTPSEATGMIEQYELGNLSYTLVSVPATGLSEVQYEVNGETATHTLMVGEKRGRNIIFSNASIWGGELSHQGNSLKLDGIVNATDIHVRCVTPYEEFKPTFEVIRAETQIVRVHPILIPTFCILLICFIYCRFVIKHTY